MKDQSKTFNFSESKIKTIINIYQNCIGVTVPEGNKPELIKIKASSHIIPYIESRPLHVSQKIMSRNISYTIFSINVIINIELISELLKYNKEVEIIKPKHLIEKFKSIIEKMNNIYSNSPTKPTSA